MTTLAKIQANRRNVALSTGPRTAEGKVVVARNATTHGIFAAVTVALAIERGRGIVPRRVGVLSAPGRIVRSEPRGTTLLF